MALSPAKKAEARKERETYAKEGREPKGEDRMEKKMKTKEMGSMMRKGGMVKGKRR